MILWTMEDCPLCQDLRKVLTRHHFTFVEGDIHDRDNGVDDDTRTDAMALLQMHGYPVVTYEGEAYTPERFLKEIIDANG